MKHLPKDIWSRRYKHINDFEGMLHEDGTHILKFYLHINPEEQLKCFKQRKEDPGRHWRISNGDYPECPNWVA